MRPVKVKWGELSIEVPSEVMLILLEKAWLLHLWM